MPCKVYICMAILFNTNCKNYVPPLLRIPLDNIIEVQSSKLDVSARLLRSHNFCSLKQCLGRSHFSMLTVVACLDSDVFSYHWQWTDHTHLFSWLQPCMWTKECLLPMVVQTLSQHTTVHPQILLACPWTNLDINMCNTLCIGVLLFFYDTPDNQNYNDHMQKIKNATLLDFVSDLNGKLTVIIVWVKLRAKYLCNHSNMFVVKWHL